VFRNALRSPPIAGFFARFGQNSERDETVWLRDMDSNRHSQVHSQVPGMSGSFALRLWQRMETVQGGGFSSHSEPETVPLARVESVSRLLKNGSATIFSFGCSARSGLDCDREGASCLPWHELRSHPYAASSLGMRIRL
jgi:hypothetical protein